jgi:starch synthase
MEVPEMKILFMAAEADPFVKMGGLGDVAGSLPQALRALSQKGKNGEPTSDGGADVRLVIPFHGVISRQDHVFRPAGSFSVPHPGGSIRAEAFETDLNGLPVYLISGPPIPKEAPVYSTDASVDGLKYTFFSLAALKLTQILGWAPDIIHANDWHTAPAIYALSLKLNAFNINAATLLGLHNLPYLGVGAGPGLEAFGLPPASGSLLPKWARQLPLPLGLLTTDHIVTVSPTYAQEILTPEFGSGLEDFLNTRLDSISGILNGIDVSYWDPEKDPAIEANYSKDSLSLRMANKTALVRELSLNLDPKIPLLAMISRMDPQKGVDLVPGALRALKNTEWQAVILGTGVPELEKAMRGLETEFPKRVRAVIRFDTKLSRRIYSGADALLIPSRYEPCGLAQMVAMRYGCVPVARSTGGLRDTIRDYSQAGESTGFLFKQASSKDLAGTLQRMLQVYAEPQAWQELQKHGMSQDFSWERSAREYLNLYQILTAKKKATETDL